MTIDRSEAEPVIHNEGMDFIRSRCDFYHLAHGKQISVNMEINFNSLEKPPESGETTSET